MTVRDRATVTGCARPQDSATRHAHSQCRWRKPILQIVDAFAGVALFLLLILIFGLAS